MMKGIANLAGCTINSPELEFDSALELNTLGVSSVYVYLYISQADFVSLHMFMWADAPVTFCVVALGCFHHM